VGFNKQGDQAFITDQSITSLAFESPFSSVSLYGQKKLVYPVYPFPIFRYDFTTGRLSQLKVNNRMDQLEMIPIPDIKRYTLVCRAFQNHSQIGDLIQKGRHLDLTSSQVIKIHFNRDSSAFIIYLSDLKNAFQALAYDEFRNRVDRIDGTMFLGKDRYATVEICDFNPRGKEILVLTKDKIRSLIEFNYGSFLYRLLGESVIDLCVNPDDRMVVLLTERSDNVFYQDTNLELISLHPFIKTRITSRRDLNRIRKCQQVDQIWFNTNYGERVMMDDQSEFHYQGVSLEGAIHDSSPDGKKVAAFINGGFFVFDWKL
jgi:hypothetical protein